MSGELAFLDVSGEEVANSYRTRSYLLRGLAGSPKWTLNGAGCEVLSREVGGTAPFVSPSADPAPWYDAAVPESAEFMGLYIVNLDFQSVDVRRTISQRFGGISGGVIGFEQVAARGVNVRAWLVASTCQGMEYGRHWIYSKLGADCNGCALGTLRVRDSCPPTDGSNDTRGEWIIYDAALVEGIKRVDNPGWPCCDYDPIEFTLAGESPYLYKRPGTATSPVEVQSTGAIMPPLPAVLDTFVRADTGPPPSASWTGIPVSGFSNGLRVLSNQLDNLLAASSGAYWNAASFGPDVTVTVVCPTRVNLGSFGLFARLTTPGAGTGEGIFMAVNFGSAGGLDAIGLRRYDETGATTWLTQLGLQTFASGDTFALVCRGGAIEAWRKPSAGAWTRIIAAYDSVTPVAGRAGVAITSVSATGQKLGAFGAGTLTNGVYPSAVVTIPMPAVSTGISSPIVTITAAEQSSETITYAADAIVSNAIRVQLKQYANCDETDAFTVDDLATKWYQTSGLYTISGGKLRPAATGLRLIRRSYDGTLAGRVQWPGGRVEATITTGATIANGSWGVEFNGPPNVQAIGAYLRQSTGVFMIANNPLGTALDSAALTTVATTTYRIILELLPTSTGYDARAWIVDQAAPTIMLTRPLRVQLATGGATTPIGPFTPSIDSVAAQTTEEWDSFYAIDMSPSDAYLNVSIPEGTIVLDGSRRVSAFTPVGQVSSVDGSAYLTTPAETPLGWPDVCAGSGIGCLQVFGGEMVYPGTLVSAALQSRSR